MKLVVDDSQIKELEREMEELLAGDSKEPLDGRRLTETGEKDIVEAEKIQGSSLGANRRLNRSHISRRN